MGLWFFYPICLAAIAGCWAILRRDMGGTSLCFRWRLAAIAIVGGIAASGCTSSTPTGPTPSPLSISCPSGAVAGSIDGNPVAVTFDVPSVAGGTQPVTTTCSPTSGSLFSVGNTSVTCQSSDSAGKSASCVFAVTVRPPPRLQYTRFLAFGDSITEGGTSDPVSHFSRLAHPLHLWDVEGITTLLLASEPYPLGVERRLTARYPLQSFRVINAGVAGEVAYEGGTARFRGALLSNQPEVVLLMEGTNDLNGASGADPAIAALDIMVQEALSQGRRVCLATIAPQRPDGLRNRGLVAQRIPPFNDRIRALAAARHVVLVDVFNAMKDDLSLIGVDDVHPTERGYGVIADTFVDAIRSNLEQPPTAVVVFGAAR